MSADKLVRDRIPDIIRAAGREPIIRVLYGNDLLHALFRKLEEEVGELLTAREAERADELADVYEVVSAIADRIGIGMAGLQQVAKAKRNERGGFDGGIYLEGSN